MHETRQQLKKRLQAAGVWPEFLTHREQLRAEGLTPAQARQEAMRRVESRVSKPGKGDAPSNGGQAEITDKSAEQSLPDFSQRIPNHEAAQWVAENLANPEVRPEEAPGGLAWSLLSWVRLTPANQATFWGSIWPKLLPTGAALKRQDETDQANEVDQGTERTLGLIDTLLDDFRAQQAKEDAELAARPNAAQFAGTLQKSLSEALRREEVLREEVKRLKNGVAKPSSQLNSGGG